MTDNEMELINIIRENDNPEQALMTATVIILGFLKQHESFGRLSWQKEKFVGKNLEIIPYFSLTTFFLSWIIPDVNICCIRSRTNK